MTDTKISALTAMTTPTDDDLMVMVDDPSGTPVTKKITFANLKAAFLKEGWISTSETWTYYNRTQAFTNTPAAGAGTVFNMASTTGFVVGDRVMITSGGGTDYPIITAVTTDTSITVTFTDYAHTAVNPLVTSLGKFTISGDYTSIYTKGTRVRWTQTTVKYGAVAYSSYAGGTTTVSLVVNTDYTVTNAAITATYYSRLESPLGWPGWFNYNAQPQGWGISPPATAYYRYSITGNTINLKIVQTSVNATSTTNTIAFVAPTLCGAAGGAGTVIYNATDNSTAMTTPGKAALGLSTAVINCYKDIASGVWTASNYKRVQFQLFYEW